MLTTPLKIGFAAACLVAVAIWIAVDQSSLRKEDPLSASATPQAVLTPPMVAAGTIVPGRAESPVICPAAAAPAPADAKPEPKPEAEKPVAAPVRRRKFSSRRLRAARGSTRSSRETPSTGSR